MASGLHGNLITQRLKLNGRVALITGASSCKCLIADEQELMAQSLLGQVPGPGSENRLSSVLPRPAVYMM